MSKPTASFYEVARELEAMEKKENEVIMKGVSNMITTTAKKETTTATKGEVIPFKNYSNNTSKKYTYKGVLNKTEFPDFVKLCKLSAKKLKQYLCREMKATYKDNCFIGDGYIYCKGEIPVLLTAHMDTVHKDLIRTYYEETTTDVKGNIQHIISSPQGIGGDDRCGVYIILEILKRGYLPHILFCEEEEIGGIGSNKFCKTKYIEDLAELKFLIELDRANSNDLVFYHNGNVDWMDWVEDETNWKISWGTFSDICHLSPACGVSSVNLSCGYYKAHTLSEYVIVEEMLETINITEHLLKASEKVEQFVYKETTSWWDYSGYGSYGGYGKSKSYGRYYDEYDAYDDYCYSKINKKTSTSTIVDSDCTYETKYNLEIEFINEDGEEEYIVIKGSSEGECWMIFFMNYPYTCFNDVLDYDLISEY